MARAKTTPPYHPEFLDEDEAFLLAISLLQDERIPAGSIEERNRREAAVRTLRRIWHGRQASRPTSAAQDAT